MFSCCFIQKQSSIAGADSNHLGRQRPGNPSEHLGNIAATEGSKFSSGGKLSVSVTIEDFNQWLEQNQQWKSKSNDKVCQHKRTLQLTLIVITYATDHYDR